MTRWLLALALVAACSKKQEAAPPPNDNPRIPETEVKRSRNFCISSGMVFAVVH